VTYLVAYDVQNPAFTTFGLLPMTKAFRRLCWRHHQGLL